MNLNDYPTPRTSPYSGVWATYWKDGLTIFELAQQLEREAAAWRDVATMFDRTCFDPLHGEFDHLAFKEARDAMNRLLAETNSEPSGQRSASADVEARTNKTDEH